MFALISKKSGSFLVWCIIIFSFLGLYSFVNHLSFDRYTIPFILGEERIPFLPWTFVFYLSIFVQYFVVIRKIPSEKLGSLVKIFLILLIIALLVFGFFPTEYPRELYPGGWFVNLFRSIDGPGNCFPSLHVAETIFMATCYSYVEKRKWSRILMWIWTLFIIVSVLTTKQHYVIDIFGGIVIVIPFLFFIKKYLT